MMGEGAGALVLEEYEAAKARGRAHSRHHCRLRRARRWLPPHALLAGWQAGILAMQDAIADARAHAR